jgi:C1A family cysteine protease
MLVINGVDDNVIELSV